MNKKNIINIGILAMTLLLSACGNRESHTPSLASPSLSNATALVSSTGVVIDDITFTNAGGVISSCTISPDLPVGLILSQSNCSITGIATATQTITTHTVTARNATSSDTATVSITINTPIFTANEPLQTDQWYLNNIGTAPDTWGQYTDLIAGADMRVAGAWGQGVSGENIIVTIVDDGVDFTHPDLVETEVAGKSVQKLSPAAIGNNDHGTGCAGIIASVKNSYGLVGIAPNSKIISYHFIGGPVQNPYKLTLEANISQVSNHSYGPPDNGQLHTQSSHWYDMIKALATQLGSGKGHVLLFSSGNGRAHVPRDYKPSELNSNYVYLDATIVVRKTFGDYAGLDMSQNHPYVISVSGFNANNKDVNYAEAGPSTLVVGATGATLPGPVGTEKNTGNPIGSLVANDATNVPSPAIATTGRNNISYIINKSFRTGGIEEPAGFNMSFNGTSAATATASGVVALILAANQNLTWRDVRWVLAKTARKIQVDSNITNQATGRPSTAEFGKAIWSTTGNATFGKFSHYFGYGAANANAAVSLVKSANYNLLPVLNECTVTVTNNVATIPATGCPNIIEFVQVRFTATSGININNETYTIQHKDNVGKIISLIAPTTCRTGVNCSITTDTTARTGTVGFLGDTLEPNDAFRFTTSSARITTSEITVFGHSN